MTSQDSILLHDSGPTIVYGTPQRDCQFLQEQVNVSNSQYSAEITALLEFARQHHQGPTRRIQRDSLLAKNRRIWNLATNVMVTGGTECSDQEPAPQHNDVTLFDDDSETQIPIQVCMVNV